MKLKYFVLILFTMQWIADVSTRNGRALECCQRTSKDKVSIENIESYIYQKPPCYKKAILFLLKSGKVLCSDPEDVWVKQVIGIFAGTKAPSTLLSSNSTTTESTVTMTIPKGTLTTWKPTTFIHGSSTKQPLPITNKQPQWTLAQTIQMTTTTNGSPSITDFETTFMITTTKSPLATTASSGTSTTWKPTSYITHKASAKELPKMTTRQITTTKEKMTVKPEKLTTSMTGMTPKGTSITWKPTAYITYKGFIKEQPMNTKTLPDWMTTRQTVTTKGRTKIKTPSITWTTKKKETLTTSKETSTTQKPVQKTSTTQTTHCPPFRKNKVDKYKNIDIPWTVRRLKKKRKQGLRRVQMNTGCIEH